jgi:hypothetical protein
MGSEMFRVVGERGGLTERFDGADRERAGQRERLDGADRERGGQTERLDGAFRDRERERRTDG